MTRLSNKASWRLFVILPIVVFALGMIVMVTISMTRKVDLVADNYYEQELKYQKQIDAKANSFEMSKSITTEAFEDGVLINSNSPELFSGKSGDITFYRPSDADKDFTIPFLLDGQGNQKVSHPKLTRGIWKIRINLQGNGQLFEIDKNVFIN